MLDLNYDGQKVLENNYEATLLPFIHIHSTKPRLLIQVFTLGNLLINIFVYNVAF